MRGAASSADHTPRQTVRSDGKIRGAGRCTGIMKLRSIVAGCLAGTLFGCATDSLSTTDEDLTVSTLPTWHPTLQEEESTQIPSPPTVPSIPRLALVSQIPHAASLSDAQTAT